MEDSGDKNHASAIKFRQEVWSRKNKLVTSCYVLDETYTFLLFDMGYEKVVRFYSRIMKMKESGILKIDHITENNEEKAWEIFKRFNVDKKWSFTDCTSKAIMEESKIKEVFAFDHHFEQMGFLRRP